MNSLSFKIFKARALQKFFGRALNIRDSWEKTPGEFKDMVSFLNWFDATDSVKTTLQRSKNDWRHRFANTEEFSRVPKGSALEIGFGGGRLLVEASKDFKEVYGVDIHANFDMTRKFLASQGVKNATLLKRDEISGLADHSIDFVYSFIVFQHFDRVEELDFYLEQIERLLSDEGIAHIYYGKQKDEGTKVVSEDEFRLRDCSFYMNPEFMREKVSQRFTLLAYNDHLPRDAASNTGESGQAMVLFQRKRIATQ